MTLNTTIVTGGRTRLLLLDVDLVRSRGWAGSRAYSDGRPDLPMLERVGHPMVVDPGPGLAEVARLRG